MSQKFKGTLHVHGKYPERTNELRMRICCTECGWKSKEHVWVTKEFPRKRALALIKWLNVKFMLHLWGGQHTAYLYGRDVKTNDG